MSRGVSRAPGGAVPPGVEVETSTWPAIEVHELGGWRLGFSGGFTRRGNSAVPPAAVTRADPGRLDDDLGLIEAFYAARSAPAIVRVAPAETPALDARLAARGYRVTAPTVVMVAPTGRAATRRAASDHGLRITVADVPDADWLTTWLGFKATSTTDRDLATRLLQGAPARYLTARDATGVVGVLRAAASEGWVGLSCLAVAERARRRGAGRRLTERALDETSAVRAFLQVEEVNLAAAALYSGLGFSVADRYHYRQR